MLKGMDKSKMVKGSVDALHNKSFSLSKAAWWISPQGIVGDSRSLSYFYIWEFEQFDHLCNGRVWNRNQLHFYC